MKKRGPIERRNEENEGQSSFSVLPFPVSCQQTPFSLGVMYLSGHAVGFHVCVCVILCCFQSVRTVGRVQECGSMLRHKQVRRKRVGKESLSELSGN